MNVLCIGASRHIGYYAAQRLLENGATVTFLLRNPKCFDKDEFMKPYIATGKARLVQGDALKQDEVRNAWKVAAYQGAKIDAVLFTMGARPSMRALVGKMLEVPDLCTRGLRNVVSTCPDDQLSPPPRIVIVSSNGLGRQGHTSLPLPLKPLYAVILRTPHMDKMGLERVAEHAAGHAIALGPEDVVSPQVLAPGWEEQTCTKGAFPGVLIVRPALYTDGECRGDTKGVEGYRVGAGSLSCAYTISRRDVAHFITEQGLKDWEKWEGKCAVVGY